MRIRAGFAATWGEIDLVGRERYARAQFGVYVPVLAVRLRSGRILSAQATWGLFGKSRERLVSSVAEHARANGIPVEVSADDLHFGWRGAKPTHWTVREITRGFR